jgi:osmotically-inducible protein OsmY
MAMHSILIKSDAQILSDVSHELEFDPSLDSSAIDVSVKDGVVTLNGTVPQFLEKSKAEFATQRVRGVRAISDEITVNLTGTISDEAIAKAALALLDWNYLVPDTVLPVVENGWITLRGFTDFECEREAAFATVKGLSGVHGVINDLVLRNKLSNAEIKAEIESALQRSTKDFSETIEVDVEKGLVNLKGKVASMNRMREARDAAWSATGVSRVIDSLTLL